MPYPYKILKEVDMSNSYKALKEEDGSHPYKGFKEEENHYIQVKEKHNNSSHEHEHFWNEHICYWEGKESEQWAKHICQKRGVDSNEVDLRGFRTKDGISLQELTRQEFCGIVGEQYGAMFWKELKSYRAMQEHRCSRCVGSDDICSLNISNDKYSIQEIPSDLSYNAHTASVSRQNSPSPRFNQESAILYPDRPSGRTYEFYAKYQERQPSSGSASPNHQEHNIYPEVYLPQSENYSGIRHQPSQLICLDENHQKIIYHKDHPARPLKPLPALISMDEFESGRCSNDVQEMHCNNDEKCAEITQNMYENVATPITIYTHNHGIHPAPYVHVSDGIVRTPYPRGQPQNVEGRLHTRVIQHMPGSHNRYPDQGYVQSRQYLGHQSFGRPTSNPTRQCSESDEDENEPGRLIIDLPEDVLIDHEIEAGDPMIPLDLIKSVPHLKKIPTKRKRDRGPKSWEFLMRLLACPKTNPSIIRWENEAEGSFRLVQPQEIANMWGTRSNKEDLSYNNFARALRYHYKTKLLYKISERQLVYGCGPAALSFYHELLKEQNLSIEVSTG